MTDITGDQQRAGLAAGDGEPGIAPTFLPPDYTLKVSASDVGIQVGRAYLLEQREARLAAHLDAAGDALRQENYTGAQEAVDRAAFLDPDDERVLRMMDRVDTECLAVIGRQVTRGRDCLRAGEITEASGCVDAALQMHPTSPEALQLRRDIEAQLLIRRWIERAERCCASGELEEAVRATEQVLSVEPTHEIALRLKKQVERALADRQARAAVDESRRKRAAGDFAGARRVLEDHADPHDLVEKELAVLREENQVKQALADRRAQAAIDESRRKRGAGDFAGARRVLEGHADPHDLVKAELASLSAEMQRRQVAFDGLVNQARDQLQRESLHGAYEPMREALNALRTDDGSTLPAPAALQAASPPGSAASVAGRPSTDGRAVRRELRWLSRAAVIGLAFAAGWGWWLALSRDATGGDSDAPLSASMVGSDSRFEAALEERSGVTEEGTAGSGGTAAGTPGIRGSGAEFDGPSTGIETETAPGASAVANGDTEGDGLGIGVETVAGTRPAGAGFDRVSGDPSRPSRPSTPRDDVALTAGQRLQAADVAFRSGQYDRARLLFQEAFDLGSSREANRGLQHVANAEALVCPDDEACGVLVVRVTPAAEIFINDLPMGSGTELQLRLRAARHRIRLETERWRFPRVTEVAAGETSELDVDLEQDGFIRQP